MSAEKWPNVTMRGCPACRKVVAASAEQAKGYQHWCEPRKDFIFGGLVAIPYAPKWRAKQKREEAA